jgi:hypothetical protein
MLSDQDEASSGGVVIKAVGEVTRTGGDGMVKNKRGVEDESGG